MGKYRHTAIVVLAALCLPCFAQFTEIWTNGNYFAVEQMASECYSASVERCSAVGIMPYSPSWWDYLSGKNHAKLVSVKSNIVACIPHYAKTSTNYPGVGQWLDDAGFLATCGLPSGALTENPSFKTQYPSSTGGWHHVHLMLMNLTTSFEYIDPLYDCDTNLSWVGFGYSSTSMTDALANAQADYNNDYDYSYYPEAYVSIYSGLHEYNVTLYRTMNVKAFASNSSGISRNVSVWSDVSPATTIFTGHGDFTSSGGQKITNIAENAIGFVVYFGRTNMVFDTSVTNSGELCGWLYSDAWIVSDWATPTNGFRYK